MRSRIDALQARRVAEYELHLRSFLPGWLLAAAVFSAPAAAQEGTLKKIKTSNRQFVLVDQDILCKGTVTAKSLRERSSVMLSASGMPTCPPS